MKEGRIAVVGSHVQGLFMRVDRFPIADETVLGWGFREALDGGKGSHQAIACARLGARTCFVGCVGADRFGETGAGWMREAGVDLTCLYRSASSPTGVGFVMVNRQGVAAITTALGANGDLTMKHLEQAEPLLAQCSIMLITFEIPVPVALFAARVGRRLGLQVILTPGPAQLLDASVFEAVDILVPNATELKILLGRPPQAQESIESLARLAQERYGVRSIVTTLGEEGASILDKGHYHHVPALPVQVVDTPGAGDAFTAGMAVALLHGCSLQVAVRFGCMVGAYAVTVRESIPAFPTSEAIVAFAAARQLTMPLELQREGG